METQPLFNIAIAISGALGGWMLKIIFDAIKEIRTDAKDLSKEVHDDYVRKDDFSSAIDRIESGLNRIFDKLDTKADK